MIEIQDVVVHELLPYLFSIGIICSLGYVYAAFVHRGLTESRFRHNAVWIVHVPLPKQALGRRTMHHWLARKVKRKEAPEGDSDDYASSFGHIQLTKRGGLQWKRTMDSPDLPNTAFLQRLPR
ncbi:hypothetical protein ACFQ88_12255 [Paenibacillus sp. NPDC056579]|uniref:hypothetical protein n=1 Tax=unclassified Paenibacillus TaxID=185978 RepID=UPI001EF94345|nr:hypothetical protein [Paenibacillus sp. H1-7]ULL15019.1 hypothetical protein DVH26_11555 [Paenibacillus sp. H1-7]